MSRFIEKSCKVTQTVHDISVIICAYTEKRWSDLIAAVESVQSQTLLPKEIIVVIDHNANLLEQVQKHLTGVIAIGNSKAKGLSGARNSGGAVAQGEVLAFLDDDALAQANWLKNLSACYKDLNVIGVGGKIEPRWEAAHPSWFPKEFYWVIGCTYQGMHTKDAQVRNMIGANMSMRKHILEATDGFRESFGCDKGTSSAQGTLRWFKHSAGDEETEFCIRASQRFPGTTWLYKGTAIVHHRVSTDRVRLAYFLWRCYDEGLGKAYLAKLYNTRTSLSSERTYTLKVLPKGIVRGLTDAFLRFDPTGLARAGVIVTGLAATALGYTVGSIYSQLTELSKTGIASIDSHNP